MGSLITIDTAGIGALGVRFIDAIENALKGETVAFRAATMARARADAMLVEAEAKIEVEYRQAFALRRVEADSLRHQKNMERIVGLSIPHLSEEAKPEEVDPDWITNFFDRVKNVSNEEFRSLWARVLAGEMNAPGAFHKRTLNVVSNLEGAEAKLFEKLCGFVWNTGPIPLILSTRDDFYISRGIDYASLMALESAGLINLDVAAGYSVIPREWPVRMSYFGQVVHLDQPPAGKGLLSQGQEARVSLGVVMFTTAGRQLYGLVEPEPVPGFLDFVLKHYSKHNPALVGGVVLGL